MILRRALRVLAVVGVWTAVSFVGPSADAHHFISFHSCDSPDPTNAPTPTPTGSPSASPTPSPTPQNCIPASDSRLEGTQVLEFSVHASTEGGPINAVDFFIRSTEDGVPHPNEGRALITKRFNRDTRPEPRNLEYTFTWDTTSLTPHNGTYRIEVISSAFTSRNRPAFGEDKSHQTAQSRNLRVDNPPKAVGAPKIVAKTASTVSLEWPAATEPDVLRYKVFRAESSEPDEVPVYGAFKEVASVTTPKLKDEIDGDGNYWYAVIVTRRSVVTPEQGISGPPSPISKAIVTTAADEEEKDDKKPAAAPVFRPRVVSKLPRLTIGSSANLRPPPVPDAPFSAVLPYGDIPEGGEVPSEDPGVTDPRGPVLPVAVGAFLVSSALALGRMPY